MRRLARLAAALALACAVPAAFPATFPAPALEREDALAASRAAVGRAPANYAFTASDGTRLDLASFRGRPLVVSFVYTGCFQVCPANTQFLKFAAEQAAVAVGRERFALATIGFNLPFDTPEAMRDYARRYGVEQPNWRFLTPEPAQLEALLADFGFTRAATPAGFDHVLQATLLDAEGRIVKQVYGESFALDALVEPLKALAAGTPPPADPLDAALERLRVLCTVYDPVTGAYRPDYALIAEMLGGLAVLVATAIFLRQDGRARRG